MTTAITGEAYEVYPMNQDWMDPAYPGWKKARHVDWEALLNVDPSDSYEERSQFVYKVTEDTLLVGYDMLLEISQPGEYEPGVSGEVQLVISAVGGEIELDEIRENLWLVTTGTAATGMTNNPAAKAKQVHFNKCCICLKDGDYIKMGISLNNQHVSAVAGGIFELGVLLLEKK